MKTIHQRARELSGEKQIPLSEAYSLLGKRGAAKRAKNSKSNNRQREQRRKYDRMKSQGKVWWD